MTVCICFLLEILVAKIPYTAIAENSRKSALFYQAKGLHPQEGEHAIHTRKDYYADTVLLNLISTQDTGHPLISVILAPYFDEKSMDAAGDYMAVAFSGKEANTYYFRYWHGSMLWLKPLLCVTEISGIFKLYKVLTLFFLLSIMAWSVEKRRGKLGISFLLAFFLGGGWEAVSCLEYGNTMLLVLAMTILYLVIGRKGEAELLYLCVINGVITCFVDFLTIETLTFTLPMGMLFLFETNSTENQNPKSQFTVVTRALCCWGFSYAGMFLIKWILAAGIIGVQGIYDSVQRTGEHMNMQQGRAMFYNIQALIHVAGASKKTQIFLVICYAILLVYVLFYLCKTGKLIFSVLVLIPYIRYMIVSNHSYLHHYFTYRAQMIAVLIIVYVLFEKIIKKRSRGKRNV